MLNVLCLGHLDWKGNSIKGAKVGFTPANVQYLGDQVCPPDKLDACNLLIWLLSTLAARSSTPLSGFAHQSIVSPPTPSPGWRQVLTLIQLHQLLLSTEGQPPTQLHFPTAFNLMPFSHGKHIVFHSGFNSIVHILKPAHQFFHDNYITTSLNESKKCPEC